MRSHYDAFDFTAFMDNYMNGHPEVVIDQACGWNIHWNPKQLDQEKHHVQVTKIQQGSEKTSLADTEGEEDGQAG
jgi:hypothetical protein